MSNLAFDVLSDCGDDQTPGVEVDVFLACACDVVDPFPTVVGTTAQGESITINDDILLAAGKKFIKLRCISDSGEIKNTLVGSKGSKSYRQSFAAKTVRGENYAEFFNNNRNGCFIAIVTEKNGKPRSMGHPKKGVVEFVSIEEMTGNGPESESVWSFEMQASPGGVAPYYNGAIDVTA